MGAEDTEVTSVFRCAECDAGLAHDQRYCIECGARRGALPPTAAATVAGILESGRQPEARRGPAAGTEPGTEPVTGLETLPLPSWLRTPRAAAAAVIGMLGFGVVVGSTVGAGVASVVPRALVVVMGGHSQPAATVASSGGGSGSGGGGGGGGGGQSTTTTTVTTPTSTQQQTTPTSTTPSGTPTYTGLPPIKHVFLIVLSDQRYNATFGSHNKYFTKTLAKQGELFPFYYGVTGGELANEIALISGQGPTPQTAQNCPQFSDFTATATTPAKYQQILGSGCVYPGTTKTLADELSGPKHGGWKAYIESMNTAPAGEPKTCRHPAPGALDSDGTPRAKDPYVTWLNPFVYFEGLIDGKSCKKDDVALPQLAKDLRSAKTTPALSYIAPDPCDDGNPEPCKPGAPAGLGPAEKFLKTVVPEIEHSPAYKADGMIAITSDQAPQTGPHADTTACSNCDPQTFPNLPPGSTTTPPGTTTTPTTPTTPTTSTTTTTGTTTGTTPTTTTTSTTTTTPGTPAGPSPGGGQVGLLVISKYMKPGSTDVLDYFNHFSLLASIEKIFKVKTLGYARDASLPTFSSSTFNANS